MRLRRFERVPEALGSNPAGLGATVARVLDAAEWLAAHDDVALASAHLVVAGDVTEERHYWPGNDDPTVMTLVQGGGLGRRVDADTALAAFVGACDGDLSVAAIVGALAQITGADEQALTADLLPAARDLVSTGCSPAGVRLRRGGRASCARGVAEQFARLVGRQQRADAVDVRATLDVRHVPLDQLDRRGVHDGVRAGDDERLEPVSSASSAFRTAWAPSRESMYDHRLKVFASGVASHGKAG